MNPNETPSAHAPVQRIVGRLDADQVEWVVNDNGELGVKIGEQFFFMYKGHSLVYDTAKHDDGSQMRWRHIGKREFGECCHPYKMDGYSASAYFAGPGYADPEYWKDLPPNPSDQRAEQENNP